MTKYSQSVSTAFVFGSSVWRNSIEWRCCCL